MLKKMVAGLLLASALPTVASALTYDFTYLGSVNGSGTLTTADTLNVKGGYDITGITGVFGGSAITGLVLNPNQPNDAVFVTPPTSPNDISYDNVFFLPPASFFDEFGIAFTTAGSVYNIFDGVAAGENPPPGTPYGLIVDGFDPTFGTFTATRTGAVPEASTWAMLLVGFGMMGGSIRYSRKTRQLSA